VHERAATRGEPSEVEEIEEGGEEDLGKRGRLFERERLGDTHRRPRVHDGLLRVAPAREERHRSLPDPPAGDSGADLGHDARALQPEDRGSAGRRRVEALTLQEVGAID